MTSACHRIASLAVELRLQEENEARPLMDRVSALRDPRLEALLQRVFEELSPPGRLDRLDAVQLDLGVLPLNGFDEAFLAQLEPVLRRAVALQLRSLPAEPPLRPVLELLRVFALTGNLPWWADRTDPGLIGAQIRRVLELDPEAWWGLLLELQANPAASERLAAACDETTLAALLAAVLPPEGDPPASVDAVAAMGRSLPGRVRLLRLAAQGLRGEVLRRALTQRDVETSEIATWLEPLEAGQGGSIPPEVLARMPEPLASLIAQGLRGEDLRRALLQG